MWRWRSSVENRKHLIARTPASAPLLIPPGRALHFAYPPALRARASMARVALLAQKCHYGLGKHKTSRGDAARRTRPRRAPPARPTRAGLRERELGRGGDWNSVTGPAGAAPRRYVVVHTKGAPCSRRGARASAQRVSAQACQHEDYHLRRRAPLLVRARDGENRRDMPGTDGVWRGRQRVRGWPVLQL